MPAQRSSKSDGGTPMSRTSSVIAIAKTPSLNAAIRPMFHLFSTATGRSGKRPLLAPLEVLVGDHPVRPKGVQPLDLRRGRSRLAAVGWLRVRVRRAVCPVVPALLQACDHVGPLAVSSVGELQQRLAAQ